MTWPASRESGIPTNEEIVGRRQLQQNSSKMIEMNHETALEYSNEIISLLFHYCMRIEPTGAVRRKEAQIDLVELIASPQIIRNNSFWDNRGDLSDQLYEPNRLQARIDMLLKMGVFKRCEQDPIIKRISEGTACYAFQYKQVKVLIFSILPPSEWGFESLLRTGDESFLNFFIEEAARKGLAMTEGHIAKSGVPLSTPEERDVFDALGLEWLEPQKRRNRHVEETDVF